MPAVNCCPHEAPTQTMCRCLNSRGMSAMVTTRLRATTTIHAIRARTSLVPIKRVVAELFETIVSFMQLYLARVLALLLVKFAVVQEQEKGTCCSASQFFSNI